MAHVAAHPMIRRRERLSCIVENGCIGTSSDKILNQMSPSYSPKNDNVAGRLWNILTAAQKLTGGTTHQQLAKAFCADVGSRKKALTRSNGELGESPARIMTYICIRCPTLRKAS